MMMKWKKKMLKKPRKVYEINHNSKDSAEAIEYLNRMTEITNQIRGDVSEDDGSTTSQLSKDEIRELRKEYREIKRKYRQEFTRLSTRNKLIDDLNDDLSYFNDNREIIDADRIQRDRLKDDTPSKRVQRINEKQGHHSNSNAFDILKDMVNDNKNRFSKDEKNALIEEIDGFKIEMADLKLKARGSGREKVKEDIVELRNRIQIFEGDLLRRIDSISL